MQGTSTDTQHSEHDTQNTTFRTGNSERCEWPDAKSGNTLFWQHPFGFYPFLISTIPLRKTDNAK